MSAIKKLTPLLIILGLGGAVGGGVLYYRHLENVERAKREQLFADLSQCLLGKPIPSDADALLEMGNLEAWAAHRPPEMKGSGGAPWPLRCGDRARDLMAAVRDSSFLEQDSKITLLDKVDLLGKEIDKLPKDHGSLTGYVAALWRDAPKLGLAMGTKSTVEGPPRPVMLEGDPHLAIAEILPLDGGPDWAFLAAKPDKSAPLGICSETKDGLACANFQGEGHVKAVGTWQSTNFIPLADGDKLYLFHDGALAETGLPPGGGNVFVDDAGTVFLVASDPGSSDRRLTVKPFGKPSRSAPLAEALSAIPDLPEDAAGHARLLGQNLMISGPSLWRVPILEGAKLGKPVDVGQGKAGLARGGCRSGATFVLEITAPASALVFFDADHVLGRTPRTVPLGTCGRSGETWDADGAMCTATGCHDPVPEPLRALLPREASVGLAGSHVVIAWGAKDGHGLLVRVAGDGDLADTPDTLILDHTDPKRIARTAVFGGAAGALVLAEVEERVVGAHVTADGKVEPLHVDWK